MNILPAAIVGYSLPMLSAWGIYAYLRAKRERLARERKVRAERSGLNEPVSLHPIIAPEKCLGCAACVYACPEEGVLGLLDGKAQLVTAANCIGHGACFASCPTDAIALVFGTATRGIEIPLIDSDFQSNLSGVYIVGELGGMGLIRNAVMQGCQAVDVIAARSHRTNEKDGILDTLIIGAGPAGLAASLSATRHQLRFQTIEQDTLGGAIAHYPRGKIVMTSSVTLPIAGPLPANLSTKEQLMDFWQAAEARAELCISYGERLESIETRERDGVLIVHTSKTTHLARSVILAIGRRGTPRTLDVPGENLPKVVYRLVDPAQYRGRRLLVVGGGDSALEAAIASAQQPGCSVALCYRGTSFSKAKQANRLALEEAERTSGLSVHLESVVKYIDKAHVGIEAATGSLKIPNDDVLVCIGGTMPTDLLRRTGILVDTKYGTP